jgi:peptidoglycan/LPS O-acetylase OafA/YrhL
MSEPVRTARATIATVFDPRNNALNALRLVLAVSVIFWHSWPLTGRTITFKPFEQFIEQVGVDGFFAISGFLITSSWLRNPSVRDYAAARLLRIFPGLWVCLIVIAFVFAPLSVAIQHGSVADLMASNDSLAYVINNGLLNVYYAGVDHTPRNVPWPGVWNGSIWTLVFEMICYIAVGILGVLGMLKRRWVVPAVFVIALIGTIVFPYPVFAASSIQAMVFRFVVMFAAGALVYQFREAIPARWSLVAVCIVIVLASMFLPNFRVLGAIPLAYAVITTGALLHHPRLNLRNDLSYGVYIYAYPVQQMLVVLGFASLNIVVFFAFATIVTVPLAALSWFLVEKQAIALKNRIKRKHHAPVDRPVLAPADRPSG